MLTTAQTKSDLRKALQDRRKSLSLSEHRQASLAAARRVLRQIEFLDDEPVALFWPLGTEIDSRPLLHALHHLGIQTLLPRTYARARPLTFHPWTPTSVLERRAFGVAEPAADLPHVDPAWLIVPLLGFDQACYRLGYGAGHYDCTLSDMQSRGLKPRTLGLAFTCQQVEEIPREAHDVPLDSVVTDTHFWRRTPRTG